MHHSWCRVIFNRSYQIRASRGGMVSASEILEELVERAGERQGFYRPRRRPKPGVADKRKGKSAAVQLELFGNPEIKRDADRPLYDLLPEAYDG